MECSRDGNIHKNIILNNDPYSYMHLTYLEHSTAFYILHNVMRHLQSGRGNITQYHPVLRKQSGQRVDSSSMFEVTHQGDLTDTANK